MRIILAFLLMVGIFGEGFSQIDLVKIIQEGKKVKEEISKGSEVVLDDLETKLVDFLLENGKAIISLAEAKLLKSMKLPAPEKEVLNQSVIQLPAEFEFELSQRDEISFHLTPGRFSKIKRLELRLNQQIPTIKYNIKDKIIFNALEGGKLNVKIRGRRFYQGKANLLVERIPAPKEVIAELVRDTVILIKKVPGILRDTAYQDILNQNYLIRPGLEITSSPFLQIPLEIPEIDNYYGFVFWIGMKSQIMLSDESDLIRVFKGDIRELPYSLHPELEWGWSNSENIQRFKAGSSFQPVSFNYLKKGKTESWGVVSGKPLIPVYFLVKNKSNLYEYPVNIIVKAIIISSYEGEIEVEEQVISEYIQLTLK
jgi:hypothetical protein